MGKIKNQCEEEVWHGWYKYQCKNPAKVKINGKNYCGIHNPEKIKEKYKKKEEKYDKERKERMYKHHAVSYCEKRGLTYEQLLDDIAK